jgi:hypothetical protein
MEAVPAALEQHKTRATAPAGPALAGARDRRGRADAVPLRRDQGRRAGVLDERAQARLDKAVETASRRSSPTSTTIKRKMGSTVESWALGSEAYDQLVGLRAFDGLDASQILEIGDQQLALNKAARVEDARRIDPTVEESVVVDRVKSNHPATFEEALAATRTR